MREQLRALDQHNPLVPLALGLLSLDQRLDTLLKNEVATGTPPLPDGDPTLALFLGIVSVRRTFYRWLEHGCPKGGDASDAASPASGGGDSLRDLGR